MRIKDSIIQKRSPHSISSTKNSRLTYKPNIINTLNRRFRVFTTSHCSRTRSNNINSRTADYGLTPGNQGRSLDSLVRRSKIHTSTDQSTGIPNSRILDTVAMDNMMTRMMTMENRMMDTTTSDDEDY
jgi:hypothetical protein